MIGLNSGLLGVRRVPTAGSASGLWVPNEQSLAKRAAIWPTTGDLYFADVSLLLHMDGSNGSTTFTDSSSNAVTVTAYGNAQISTTQSKFGGASGYFDGSGDYLTVSSHPTIGSQDFTIEFWLYPNTVTGLQIYLDFRPANGAYPLIYSDGASIYYYVNTTARITGAITQSQWQHVAVTRAGTTTRMFIDGTQAGSSWTDTTDYLASTPLICKSFDNYYANCYFDDLRITTGVARYTSNFTPPTAAFPN
jgi:hypothetical protein